MPSGLYEEVWPYVPAFTAYEKGVVEWFGHMPVPRDSSHHLRFKVEYAGGERAIRAIKALKGDDARGEKVRTPVTTIKLVGVEYNQARYHPPESPWATITDGPRGSARRVARIAKGAPYKLTYEIQVYPSFEVDLRYAMGLILNKFHHHGGLSYVKVARPYPESANGIDDGGYQFFPMFLRSYSHGVQSEGDAERQVRGTFTFELEAYLALPYHFIPSFRRLHAEVLVAGNLEPGTPPIVVGPGNGQVTQP